MGSERIYQLGVVLMEIKDTLNKPYTEKQRLDFVIKHQYNYVIKETSTALEAWGKTEEEKSAEAKQAQREAIIAQLAKLDLEAIRPIRAKEAGTATQEDLDRLAEIEQQAAQIRAELQNL